MYTTDRILAAATGLHTPVFLVAFFMFFIIFTWASPSVRRCLVLAASAGFYLCAGLGAVLVLAVASALNFVLVGWMDRVERRSTRKLWLILCILITLSFLAWWKYLKFALGIVGLAPAEAFGLAWTWPLNMAAPLGISFFSFLQISYAVDVFQRKVGALSLYRYAQFILFFPKMVSGPLVRAKEFGEELDRLGELDRSHVSQGLQRLAVGMVKKIFFADALAAMVNPAFSAHFAGFSGWHSMFVLHAYAFQIYFDFSGYADMAIGVAQMLGCRLPENFDRPYLSESIRDFWRRWHITLGGWLRDYLYIPLGGSRVAEPLIVMNLLITFLLCGLWHGASWNFVIWGGIQGAGLVVNRYASLASVVKSPSACKWISRFLTFNVVVLAWLFFRSPDLKTVGEFVGTLGSLPCAGSELLWPAAIAALVGGYGLLTWLKARFLATEMHPAVSMAAIAVAMFFASSTVFEATPFIYANF